MSVPRTSIAPRIGIIGCGSMSLAHAARFNDVLDRIEVTAVVDIAKERALDARPAVRGSHFGTNRCTPWMEREGTSNVTIEFEGGILGYHFGTWGAQGSRLKYSIHAHCEEGMIEATISEGKLIAHTEATEHMAGKPVLHHAETVLLEAPDSKPTEIELAHFLDCIETGAKPLTDPVGSLMRQMSKAKVSVSRFTPVEWPAMRKGEGEAFILIETSRLRLTSTPAECGSAARDEIISW